MRRVYSWIVCLVICIGSNVSMEAQTLINYQQQKQKEIAEDNVLKNKNTNLHAKKGRSKHSKST